MITLSPLHNFFFILTFCLPIRKPTTKYLELSYWDLGGHSPGLVDIWVVINAVIGLESTSKMLLEVSLSEISLGD